jgi:hypothetical protein
VKHFISNLIVSHPSRGDFSSESAGVQIVCANHFDVREAGILEFALKFFRLEE